MFSGKTSKELDALQNTITQQIESGAAMDVEYYPLILVMTCNILFSFIANRYWETLLKRLVVYRAKAKLKEIHADMLRQKLAELEELQKNMYDFIY